MGVSESTSNVLPFVSIVIPVLNGEKYLSKCLESIFNINYSKELFEVIVVDNGSTDRTIEIARKYNVKILIKPNVNVSAVRNYGAENSKGKILAFVDSDCVVSLQWLNNAVPYFQYSQIAIVGSLCNVPDDCTWVGKAWDICQKKRRLKGTIDRLGSGNMIMRKKCFEQVQGFDENLITGEDDDICYRLRKCGYEIYSDPAIDVCHLDYDRNLLMFFKKGIWRSYETFRLFLKDKGKINFKITVYALYYLTVMLGIFLSIIYILIFQKGYIILFVFLLFLIVLPFYFATTTGFRSNKWKYFFHFATLYLTLGIASAIAILKIKTNYSRQQG